MDMSSLVVNVNNVPILMFYENYIKNKYFSLSIKEMAFFLNFIFNKNPTNNTINSLVERVLFDQSKNNFSTFEFPEANVWAIIPPILMPNNE